MDGTYSLSEVKSDGLDEIHEAPVLAQRDHSVLEVNMTETVEPGVYLPGTGGVRIEDTVVIKQDGISILTLFPKKFLQV